ncbi:MAG: ABC transporter substrate-binding protein [Desulfobacteraceae bacterium]|nr:ABC transporter substrate-binding protein [Desulfobacteraceae bacterium]
MTVTSLFHRRLLLIISLAVGASVFWAIPMGAAQIERLTIGTTMQVKVVNIDDYYFGTMRAMLTHKGLIRIGEDGRFTGDLARSWETTDAVTWTFHLNSGLTWHDGRPVTADDVKFTIEYLLAKIPVYTHHFKLITGVTAPDSATVVISLSEPNPRFVVNLLVLRTLPRHIFETVDDPMTFQGDAAAMGCGPYTFAGFDAAAGTVRFTAYDNYYRGQPNVAEVVFRMFKNPDTLYMALKKGEIDLPYFYAAGTDPVHVAPLVTHKNLVIHELPNTGVPNAIFFNTQKPPMDDVRLRKALGMAVDYTEMVRLFAGGYGSVPNAGFVPKGSADFIDTPRMAHDPDQAKKILAGLGYTDSDRNGVLEKEGRDLTIDIIVRTDTPGSRRIAELLKKRFAAIGVVLNIKPVDYTLFRQISDKERGHMTLLSRTTPWGMMMWAGCGSGYFDSRNIGWAVLKETRFRGIVDRMNTAIDPEIYKTAAADLQRYYADQLPGLPLYWNVLLQPCNKAFSGWKISPMYGFLWEETWFNLRKE